MILFKELKYYSDYINKQGVSTLSPPKIVVTSIIFLQLKFLVTYMDVTSWIIFICFKYI